MTSFAAMTPTQRSEHMAKIRGRDTQPELRVREFLRSAQIKFSTYADDLPGTPDIVARAARVVVFVHGCFWHQHGCRRRRPKVNREFWDKKFARNVARDKRAAKTLRADGWRVLVVWECQVRSAREWRARLLRALAPHRRLCHDCTEIAKAGFAHCAHCRSRYARGSSPPKPRRKRAKKSSRAERLRLLRLGLCTSCAMPADGHTCPWHHKHEAAQRAKARRKPGYMATYQRRAAIGLCRCGAAVKPGHKRCGRCLGELRREAKERNARYFKAGRCRYCPEPRLPHTFTCETHNKKLRVVNPIYVKRFVERSRQAGKCVTCGRASKKLECARCRRETNQKARSRAQDRRAAGKCSCGRKAARPYKMCSRCRARARSRYRDSRVHGA